MTYVEKSVIEMTSDYMHDRALECLESIELIRKVDSKNKEHAICILLHSALEYELLYQYNFTVENLEDVIWRPSMDELILLVDRAPSFVEVYHNRLSDLSVFRNHREMTKLPNMIERASKWIKEGIDTKHE